MHSHQQDLGKVYFKPYRFRTIAISTNSLEVTGSHPAGPSGDPTYICLLQVFSCQCRAEHHRMGLNQNPPSHSDVLDLGLLITQVPEWPVHQLAGLRDGPFYVIQFQWHGCGHKFQRH